MSNFLLENIILSLLENRGTLKFKQAGISDDRRATMPLPASKILTRAKLAGIEEDEIDTDKGVAFGNKSFANVDTHPYGMKTPPLVYSQDRLQKEKLKANKSLNATMRHEDLHATFTRLLDALNIDEDSIDVIISELFENVKDEDLKAFNHFMSILKTIAKDSGANKHEIEQAFAGDEQIAYLLTYLESPMFRKQIMSVYARKYSAQVPVDFYDEWKKFDSSLKRVWRQLQKAAQRV